MHKAHPNAELIDLPVHASWLNQAELFFAIVQRKAFTPNDFGSLQELARRLMGFGQHYPNGARPFRWTLPATTSTASWPRSPSSPNPSRSPPEHRNTCGHLH
jgi:hypothetical protein